MKKSFILIFISFLALKKVVSQNQDCQVALDLVFIVDSSGSVGINSFNQAKDAMKNIVNRFNIGENNAIIGLINYSSHVETVLSFILQQQMWSQDLVRSKIDSMQFKGQSTATGDAIYSARNSIFTINRGIVPRLAIVFTDGNSNQGRNVVDEAQLLKNDGIDIFAIGIGNGINDFELNSIASIPKSTYKLQISSYNALFNVINNITQIACNTNAFIPLFVKIQANSNANQLKYYQTNLENYPKGGYAHIKVEHEKGRTNFYYSIKDKNPKTSDPIGRSASLTNTNEYYVYIPPSTPRLYLTSHGIEEDNAAQFEVDFNAF